MPSKKKKDLLSNDVLFHFHSENKEIFNGALKNNITKQKGRD